MEYSFNYKLIQNEFADFSAYTSWYAGWQKKFRLIYLLKTFIYSGISMIVTFFILTNLRPLKNKNYSSLFVTLTVINIILTCIHYYNAPIRIKKKAKKLVEKEENYHFLYDTETTFTNTGILSIDKLSTTTYSWDSIVKFVVTKEYFYLYISSIQGLIIPKRLFASQKEIEGFEKFITEKIPISSSFRSLGI